MTREEAKEVFINRGFVLTNDGNNTIYDPDKRRESVNVISKWLERNELEQEPFMNKPCVAHQVCHEDKIKVLDKIKSEIEEQVLESLSDGGDDWFTAEKVNECLEIIDKYRAESEDKG